ELVGAAALAAVAAGADGLLVEAHPDPESARSDSEQQLTPGELLELAGGVKRVARAVGRKVRGPIGDATPTVRNGATNGHQDAFVNELRSEISDNDRAIVEAINTRVELVRRMHAYKSARGLPFRDAEREEALLRYLAGVNPGPLSPDGLEDIVVA